MFARVYIQLFKGEHERSPRSSENLAGDFSKITQI